MTTFDLSLQGTHRDGIRIQFYGMFQGYWSVANVSTQFAKALIDRYQDVAIHSYNGGEFSSPELRHHAYVDHRAPVGFFYGFPSDITEPFFEHPFRIGGFVCETDRIQPEWVEVANRLHLIVVPSTFVKQAFRDSGVNAPIMVVPHGLEPEYVPVKRKQRTTPLIFYNCFHSTSFLERKSVEELVRCFLNAFGPDGQDCVLYLRTDISGQLAAIRRRHDFGRAIKIQVADNRDTAEFARIYSEVHCTVHPSKGEGFGLIPLQSIACETPVIAPAVTGMADYLDATNAMCLRTCGRATGQTAGNRAGAYFCIDEEHLTALLVHASENWEAEYRRVCAAGPIVRSRYTWKKVLAEFLDLTAEILDTNDPERLKTSLAQRFG